jgi:uncharacterized protein (DUF697 family)
MAHWWKSWTRGIAAVAKAREVVRQMLQREGTRPAEWEARLSAWQDRLPLPVFWLVGKTQSGKTSIIRYLTGASDAVIGAGFRPTTRSTRRYDFPTAEAPLLAFLDTRGLDEPGYDPRPDIAACSAQAHCVIATVKVTDPAQATVRGLLESLRRERPDRPIVLCLTCLHEADIATPLPQPYPFRPVAASEPWEWPAEIAAPLRFQLERQLQQFAGLYDLFVPLDLTRPEDGFPVPDYGGEALKKALAQVLPHTYRQTLLQVESLLTELKDLHLQQALPVVIGYSMLAGTIGALPIPLADLPLLLSLHVRMARHLAGIYGQSLRLDNYRELAAILGVSLITRQLTRQLAKLIPVIGSVVGGAVAFASTYALGRALCYYFETVAAGHVPDAATLRRVYQEQFAAAEAAFHRTVPSAGRESEPQR